MVEAILKHVALPAVAPAAVIGLYFTPVLLFGCVNRGLLALAVVLLSAGAALATARIGLREQARMPDQAARQGRHDRELPVDVDRQPRHPVALGVEQAVR